MTRSGWIDNSPAPVFIISTIAFAIILIITQAIASRMLTQASRTRRCIVLIAFGVWTAAFWLLITAPIVSLWTDPFDPAAVWTLLSLGLLIGLQTAMRDDPPPKKPISYDGEFIQHIMAKGMFDLPKRPRVDAR